MSLLPFKLRQAAAFFEQPPPPRGRPPEGSWTTLLRDAAAEIERLVALTAPDCDLIAQYAVENAHLRTMLSNMLDDGDETDRAQARDALTRPRDKDAES